MSTSARGLVSTRNTRKVRVSDRDAIYNDEQFRALYHKVGQLAEQPWRLAIMSIIQYMENYTDRQVAEATAAVEQAGADERIGRAGVQARRAGAAVTRPVRLVGPQPHRRHLVEDPAVDGLEPVAGVGQRAAVDDRVRVLQVRAPHLRRDVGLEDAVRAVAGRGQIGRAHV